MNELGEVMEVTLLKELLTRKTENGHFIEFCLISLFELNK